MLPCPSVASVQLCIYREKFKCTFSVYIVSVRNRKITQLISKHELQARLDGPVEGEAKAELMMLYVTEFSRSGWCALPAHYVAQKLSQGR